MKVLKRLLAGILAVALLISLPTSSFEVSAASGIPGFKAKVTEKNILKILNKYDKDGAYIMKKQMEKGDNILTWFSGGRMLDGMNTAVHEETHGYSYSYGTYSFQVRQRHILLAIRKQCMFRIQWFISQKKWQKRYPNA